MLNFRGSTVLFLLVTGIMFVLSLWFPVSLYAFVFVGLAYLFSIAVGSARIDSNYFIPVICKSNKHSNEFALTFDDGPDEVYTPKILDILKHNEVHATFFCIGRKAELHPDLINRIHSEGHLIGNHSYSHHLLFDFFTGRKIIDELKKTNSIIESVIKKEVKYFRPPYGVTTPPISVAVKNGGFAVVGWSLRSMDTITKDPEIILDKCLSKVNGGDIVLFHDTMDSTSRMLQKFIDRTKSAGFKIIPLDQLIKIPAYA